MPMIQLKLPHHCYEIRVEPGALNHLGGWVRQVAAHGHAALVCDLAIMESHGVSAQQSLAKAGYGVLVRHIAGGEKNKNLQTVHSLYDVLLDNKIERSSPIIAMGGGVVGDTVGFVAATYLRGVPLIQCPTTLLAMVDASVGGKTGVNLPQGKNLVGCFYQPHLVVIDPCTLTTLPPMELRGGLAECVKHAVIRDADLFAWLEQNLDPILSLDIDALTELIQRNVQIKAAVVMADEKETGQRAHLNFGHTFAHAIEVTQGYAKADGYHHGQAVSLGMVAATRLAVDTGRCQPGVLERLIHLLDRIALPTCADDLPSTPVLLDAMCLDKKVQAGRLRLVLPDQMGAVSIVSDVPGHAITSAWESIRSMHR